MEGRGTKMASVAMDPDMRTPARTLSLQRINTRAHNQTIPHKQSGAQPHTLPHTHTRAHTHATKPTHAQTHTQSITHTHIRNILTRLAPSGGLNPHSGSGVPRVRSGVGVRGPVAPAGGPILSRGGARASLIGGGEWFATRNRRAGELGAGVGGLPASNKV